MVGTHDAATSTGHVAQGLLTPHPHDVARLALAGLMAGARRPPTAMNLRFSEAQ
jgi:hypothetical protein